MFEKKTTNKLSLNALSNIALIVRRSNLNYCYTCSEHEFKFQNIRFFFVKIMSLAEEHTVLIYYIYAKKKMHSNLRGMQKEYNN